MKGENIKKASTLIKNGITLVIINILKLFGYFLI